MIKMKNRIIISILFLSVGFSQQLAKVVETYENGNIKSITSHKETRNRIEKVKYVEYYENGQKSEEVKFKDGKIDGKGTRWYENGNKREEVKFKDGKEDGLVTRWHENGQKEFEITYKDGESISSRCWDEDGNECECSEKWWEGCK